MNISDIQRCADFFQEHYLKTFYLVITYDGKSFILIGEKTNFPHLMGIQNRTYKSNGYNRPQHLFNDIIGRNPVSTAIIPNNISTFLVNIIYKLDNPPINLLPSMHCSFCFLFIFSTLLNKNIEKKYRIIILILSILIILSTLFIKQHLLIDILASFIISSLTFILVKHTKLNQVLIRLNLVK